MDTDEFLGHVLDAIDERIDDESFDVSSLARRLAMSRAQLYRRLKTHQGLTPSELIMRRRLECAATLLTEYTMPVGDAAFAVGFKTVAHFTERFRVRYGAPPATFRDHFLLVTQVVGPRLAQAGVSPAEDHR